MTTKLACLAVRFRFTTITLTVLALAVRGGACAGPATATTCPNEAIRAAQVWAESLPDCRAYEQVSPAEKNGSDALGAEGLVQVSPSGSTASYFSLSPFPGVPASGEFPTYIAARGGEGWTSTGVFPLSNPGSSLAALGLSSDLSVAMIVAKDTEAGPPIGLEGSPGHNNYYVRDTATGTYRLVASGLPGVAEAAFAGVAADNSHVVFESGEQLLPAAPAATINLYDWHDGQLSLVDVLANEVVPPEGASAGPGGPALEGVRGGATGKFYVEHAVSRDGRSIYFTEDATGQIYLRLNGSTTLHVSASEAGAGEERPSQWRDATPDGRFALFTSDGRLTRDSTAEPGHADLYLWDADSGELRDLSVSAKGPADVFGTLGMSEDARYVYFVAKGVLAAGATQGAANLYVWHDGSTAFVAGLDVIEGHTVGPDQSDWTPSFASSESASAANGAKSSRVTPDGAVLMFTSRNQLTSYDSREHIEIYRYDAKLQSLACASCNPNGVPARADALLAGSPSIAAPIGRNSFLTRNLSTDGSRVFFQDEEALLQADHNNVSDVYEWENGHLFLLTPGDSQAEAYFGDASASGEDVLLFSRQRLVGIDHDDNVDLYDARVGGGYRDQMANASGHDCEAGTCRSPLQGPPEPEVPPTVAGTGTGNLHPVPAAPPTAPPRTRAERRAAALRACRRHARGRRRRTCERSVFRRYGHPGTAPSRAHRSSR